MNLTRREFMGSAAALALAPRNPYRACIIGHTGRGGFGHGLDIAFQKIPGIAVVAVADPVEKGRLQAQQRSGATRAYADWREMLREEKPNLVSIGMRCPEGRAEVVVAAAEAGAHVFLEKPMAATPAEADAIVAASEKNKVKIALAHQARVAPSVVHLKKLIEGGLIGDLLEIRARGKEDARAGGEDMMVLGWHCFYLMRYFAGDALWCSARVMQNGRDVVLEDRRAATEPLGPIAGDTIHASYAFKSGVQGHFASQKTKPGGRFQIALYGSKGVVSIPIGADPKITWVEDPLWLSGAGKPLPDALESRETMDSGNKRLVEDLLRAAETGGEPVSSAREGRAVLDMILSVYASHLAGGRVALPLKDRRHPLGTF